jgi:hypothetical protein
MKYLKGYKLIKESKDIDDCFYLTFLRLLNHLFIIHYELLKPSITSKLLD